MNKALYLASISYIEYAEIDIYNRDFDAAVNWVYCVYCVMESCGYEDIEEKIHQQACFVADSLKEGGEEGEEKAIIGLERLRLTLSEFDRRLNLKTQYGAS